MNETQIIAQPQGQHLSSMPDAQGWMGLMQFAEFVSKAGLLPDHLKNKPADCLLVAMQSQRWKMDFFAVAQCTSLVRGRMMYEGKLVAAVVNASGLLKGALNHHFIGDAQPRLSIVITGFIKDEDKPREWEVTWDEAFKHAQDKAQWLASPKKRLLYFATREWARVHMPEVMLGVQADDEQLPSLETKPEATRAIPLPSSQKIVEAQDDRDPDVIEHWSELYPSGIWREWKLPQHSQWADMTINDVAKAGQWNAVAAGVDAGEYCRFAIDCGRFAAIEQALAAAGITVEQLMAECVQTGAMPSGQTFFDATPQQLTLITGILRAMRQRQAEVPQ